MKGVAAIFLFICVGNPLIASACSVCFGDPDSPLTKGMGFGIWTLMGFIGMVLALFAVLFWNIRQRMKKISKAQSINKYNAEFNAC